MKKTIKILVTILPFLYMIAIWIMSSKPDDIILDLPSSTVDRFIKEALHLVEFAILYILFVSALAVNHKLKPGFSLVAAFVAGLYGIVDEYHQSFIPYRSASLIDVAKDIIGVLAVYFHVQYHYFKHKRGFLTLLEKFGAKK
ncbi:VanZ family protein [Peribacillus sp. NPDC046944]|uniref:VanZ family protein n=1 Tax=unclassified Peribacillus TaxID=2675266 RepID=UPI00381872AC